MGRKNRSLSGKAQTKRNMTGETKAEASEAVKDSKKKVTQSPADTKDPESLEDVKHGFQFEDSKVSDSPGHAKDSGPEDSKVSDSPGHAKDSGPLEDMEHGLEAPRRKVSESPEDEKESRSLQDIKHPLENSWGFWMNTNLNKKQWEKNIVELTMFGTVEDFWCLYHHMKPPSELTLGQDYSVFKNNTRPMWEDEANKKGGRWLIPVERRKDLDWMWLDVVLLMIGENFESNDLICGAVVNVRGKCKIGVWTADCTKESANKEIGRKLKNQLRFQGKLGFQLHDSPANLYMV